MGSPILIRPSSATGIDTFLFSTNPDTEYGSMDTIYSSNVINVLIKFDLSSIPSNASLTLVRIDITSAPGGYDGNIRLYRILAANDGWTEGSTWNYAIPSSRRWAGDVGSNGGSDAGCSVSGTDHSSTLMGTISFGGVSGTTYSTTLNLTEMELMRQNNYGFVLKKPAGEPSSSIFYSCETSTSNFRPALYIEYVEGRTKGPALQSC